MDTASDKALQRFAELMIEKIQQVEDNWQQPWFSTKGGGLPQNIDGRNYNGVNSFMLFLLTEKEQYGMPVYMTFMQAKEKGLVDKLGGLDAVVKAAAARASVADYEVSYIEKPLSPRDQLLAKLLDNGEESDGGEPGSRSLVDQTVARPRAELQGLALWNDPGHTYLHCLCEAP